jgi:hypothetical protein
MTARQFCPACPTDMPDHRETGQWVEVEGHEHPLPLLRPEVYLSGTDPHEWGAYLSVTTDRGWLGYREFPTMQEAMDYARTVLVPMSLARRATRPVTLTPEGAS